MYKLDDFHNIIYHYKYLFLHYVSPSNTYIMIVPNSKIQFYTSSVAIGNINIRYDELQYIKHMRGVSKEFASTYRSIFHMNDTEGYRIYPEYILEVLNENVYKDNIRNTLDDEIIESHMTSYNITVVKTNKNKWYVTNNYKNIFVNITKLQSDILRGLLWEI